MTVNGEVGYGAVVRAVGFQRDEGLSGTLFHIVVLRPALHFSFLSTPCGSMCTQRWSTGVPMRQRAGTKVEKGTLLPGCAAGSSTPVGDRATKEWGA